MLNKKHALNPDKILSLNQVAEEMSILMPQFIRYMHPYIYKSIDIPPAQIFVLVTVEEEKTCNLTVLRKKLRIAAPTASGLVDRLVKRNYLNRTPDQGDRRVINVTLTKAGKAVVRKFQQNVLEMWKVNLKSFTPAQRMGPLLFIKQILKDIQNEKIN